MIVTLVTNECKLQVLVNGPFYSNVVVLIDKNLTAFKMKLRSSKLHVSERCVLGNIECIILLHVYILSALSLDISHSARTVNHAFMGICSHRASLLYCFNQ